MCLLLFFYYGVCVCVCARACACVRVKSYLTGTTVVFLSKKLYSRCSSCLDGQPGVNWDNHFMRQIHKKDREYLLQYTSLHQHWLED